MRVRRRRIRAVGYHNGYLGRGSVGEALSLGVRTVEASPE